MNGTCTSQSSRSGLGTGRKGRPLASCPFSVRHSELHTCHVALNLPINNETCNEIASLTAACSLQPRFWPELQGAGLLHPQYHYLQEAQIKVYSDSQGSKSRAKLHGCDQHTHLAQQEPQLRLFNHPASFNSGPEANKR